MSTALPVRPSLEYLRKVAKDRLAALRRARPDAQLADALFAVAQEYGFPSWRSLKAEIDRRRSTSTDRFFAACRKGDVEAIGALLAHDPTLIGLRDEEHHATGLHFAAAHIEAARVLIDAGADVNATGDVSEIGVIGWLTCFPPSGRIPRDALALLLDRGARHHVFSAIAVADLALIRTVIEQHPEELDRRLSRLDHGQTPLHFAITRKRLDILGLLIELGADVDAVDTNGHTAVEYAMLRGDRDAAARLVAAGAAKPAAMNEAAPSNVNGLAASVRKAIPVLYASDIAATLRWYRSVGFTEVGRYPQDGSRVFWGMVKLGAAELMFDVRVPDASGTTLLLTTVRINDVYQFLRSRQMKRAGEPSRDDGDDRRVEFVEDLHEPAFGGLQFTVRDPNGYALRFLQEADQSETEVSR
jgi:ankyrin repeat protein